MLTYKINDEGCFAVIEESIAWDGYQRKVVTYKTDLSQKRVNDEPWRDTTENDRGWFEKYYRNKFEKL